MQNYEYFGVMLDVSRNAVMNVKTLKKFIDCLHKMGYNSLELYAEDTYKVDGEPYFGYQRGAYTGEEIKEIDAYCKSKGMELIPCIQTLAHFTNLVRLAQYKSLVDVNDILCIDDERVYELIDKMFATISKNFTSRRINIGMDEAHMVGLGRYLDEHGYHDRFELINKHLNRVCEIASKYGFTPHMWSDMYFRLANHGEYYGDDIKIDKSVLEGVPENIEFAYWDYYHDNVETYNKMFKAHKEFGRELWFAGGAWTWYGFAPYNYYSLKTMRPAMEGVINQGVKNVMITMWGDDGKECSSFAVIPALYAIRQYADGNFDDAKIAEGFEKLFGCSYEDFSKLDIPNFIKSVKEKQTLENPCKTFFYMDCFNGAFDDYAEQEGQVPYADYAKELYEAGKKAKDFSYIFNCLGDLCEVLDVKMLLGVKTRKAYRAGDKEALKNLIADYDKVLKGVEKFYESFKALWFEENKAFGWEVQDIRLGGLMQRIKCCRERLDAYVNGKTDIIEELEEDILRFHDDGVQGWTYGHLVSRSTITW